MDHDENLNQLFQYIQMLYEEKVPFHKFLGIEIQTINVNDVCIKIKRRDELIGNYVKQILHGGVIFSLVDIAGGLTTSVALLKNLSGYSYEEKLERLYRIGTIDLKIDFLRPGRGTCFYTKGLVLRAGRNITFTRMEFSNDQDKLIAVGTGTYSTR